MLSINISELIWTIVNFFLLLLVLDRFLYKPILRFMDERKARIDSGIEAKKNAELTETEQTALLEAELDAKRAEAKALLADEKLKDDKQRADMLNEARRSAAALRQELKAEAAKAGEEEKTALKGMEDELASRLAERLLRGKAE